MPDGIKTEYKITGTADLAGFLADLKPSTQSRIIAGAVMAGSKPIVTLAKSKVVSPVTLTPYIPEISAFIASTPTLGMIATTKSIGVQTAGLPLN